MVLTPNPGLGRGVKWAQMASQSEFTDLRLPAPHHNPGLKESQEQEEEDVVPESCLQRRGWACGGG
jgi:hypothetical protein